MIWGMLSVGLKVILGPSLCFMQLANIFQPDLLNDVILPRALNFI